jgi:hypothetical protein
MLIRTFVVWLVNSHVFGQRIVGLWCIAHDLWFTAYGLRLTVCPSTSVHSMARQGDIFIAPNMVAVHLFVISHVGGVKQHKDSIGSST